MSLKTADKVNYREVEFLIVSGDFSSDFSVQLCFLNFKGPPNDFSSLSTNSILTFAYTWSSTVSGVPESPFVGYW